MHHLLLEGVGHELASRYRSVCERRGRSFRPDDDDAIVSAFTSFCHAYRDQIVERCTTRATQTNEVGRCSALRAAVCEVGDGDGPVALVDLGCSAGLNLLVDAYGYDYAGTLLAGTDPAGPVLACALEGRLPPLQLPAIASRVGLDLSPVDVLDDDAVLWLLSCVWPDDDSRRERLERAVGVAARRAGELRLVTGDMVDDLQHAVASSDADAMLVVIDSWSAAYLPPPRRLALADAIAAVASRRAVTWIAMEYPSVLRDLGVLAVDAPLAHRGASVVCVTTYDRGTPLSRVAAETHAHGAWLDWREADLARGSR